MQIKSGQVLVPDCLSTKEGKDMLDKEPELISIINSCLAVNAADRPQATQLVQASDDIELTLQPKP